MSKFLQWQEDGMEGGAPLANRPKYIESDIYL